MLLIVGGQRRKIGKTALIETILREFPDVPWTAVKITTHHEPPPGERAWVLEEGVPSPETDTGRYLRAGASRAYLVRTAREAMAETCGGLRRGGVLEEPAIIESAAAAEHLTPAVFLFLVDADPDADSKESARRYLRRADAFVVTVSGRHASGYNVALPAGVPRFYVRPLEFRSRPLMEFVARGLGLSRFSPRPEGSPAP